MFTVIETPTFSWPWLDYWIEGEYGKFVIWLIENLESGDVIPTSGGGVDGIRDFTRQKKRRLREGGVGPEMLSPAGLSSGFYGLAGQQSIKANPGRIHKTPRVTSAMAAAAPDHIRTLEEIAGLADD